MFESSLFGEIKNKSMELFYFSGIEFRALVGSENFLHANSCPAERSLSRRQIDLGLGGNNSSLKVPVPGSIKNIKGATK